MLINMIHGIKGFINNKLKENFIHKSLKIQFLKCKA